jgi:hypothetical protein
VLVVADCQSMPLAEALLSRRPALRPVVELPQPAEALGLPA